MLKKLTLSCGTLPTPCRIYEPRVGTVQRCIIGVHGLGGSNKSVCLAAIAEEMALYNTATVCPDLPAHGESRLPDRALTLASCREALLSAAELARTRYPDAEELCVFATSFGAYLTLLALRDLTERAEHLRIVLRAPAVQMAQTFLKIAGLTAGQLLEQGRVQYGFGRVMELPYSLYEEISNSSVDFVDPVPMLLIQGGRDETVLPQDVVQFTWLNECAELLIMPETDHRFKAPGEMEKIVDLARDWFLCGHVLQDDWS